VPFFALPGWVGIVAIVFAVSIAARIGRGGGRRLGRGKWDGFSDDLDRRIAELEESQRQLSAGGNPELERRVQELEERVDFAERMLAKQRDPDRLGPPKA
jgi:hypothetical protein